MLILQYQKMDWLNISFREKFYLKIFGELTSIIFSIYIYQRMTELWL